jgi:Glycosyl transferase family 2
MKIHAHILSWNEEKILPYTLDHYSFFCEKIFVYDNMSTDSSYEIYAKYPKVIVIQWNSDNQINELNYIQIKSHGYKTHSRDADWVIVCDCDEFLYHKDLLGVLTQYKKENITVPRIEGHDMVSAEFPTYDGKLLTDKVKIGSDVYGPMCKNIIFDPTIDVNYGIGGHSFNSNNTVYSQNAELKLLHYKFLGKEYVKQIYISRAKRLSEFNKNNKFGEHYFNLPFEYMDKMLREKKEVI